MDGNNSNGSNGCNDTDVMHGNVDDASQDEELCFVGTTLDKRCSTKSAPWRSVRQRGQAQSTGECR